MTLIERHKGRKLYASHLVKSYLAKHPSYSLTYPLSDRDRLQQILWIEHYEQGITQDAVAAEIGIEAITLRRVLLREGISFPFRSRSDAGKNNIKKTHSQEASQKLWAARRSSEAGIKALVANNQRLDSIREAMLQAATDASIQRHLGDITRARKLGIDQLLEAEVIKLINMRFPVQGGSLRLTAIGERLGIKAPAVHHPDSIVAYFSRLVESGYTERITAVSTRQIRKDVSYVPTIMLTILDQQKELASYFSIDASLSPTTNSTPESNTHGLGASLGYLLLQAFNKDYLLIEITRNDLDLLHNDLQDPSKVAAIAAIFNNPANKKPYAFDMLAKALYDAYFLPSNFEEGTNSDQGIIHRRAFMTGARLVYYLFNRQLFHTAL